MLHYVYQLVAYFVCCLVLGLLQLEMRLLRVARVSQISDVVD